MSEVLCLSAHLWHIHQLNVLTSSREGRLLYFKVITMVVPLLSYRHNLNHHHSQVQIHIAGAVINQKPARAPVRSTGSKIIVVAFPKLAVENMAETHSTKSTFLGLPTEIRLRIYHYLFGYDDNMVIPILCVCGYKHRLGHDGRPDDLPLRGKRVAFQDAAFQITQTCRQIRSESLPKLLATTVIYCCHLGARLVNTHLTVPYKEYARYLRVNIQDFDPAKVESFRPNVPHRRCRTLPSLPRLCGLVLDVGICYKLANGFKREDLEPTMLLRDGETLIQAAREHVMRTLQESSSSLLLDVLLDPNREFQVSIRTSIGDVHAKPPGETGVGVVSQPIASSLEAGIDTPHSTFNLIGRLDRSMTGAKQGLSPTGIMLEPKTFPEAKHGAETEPAGNGFLQCSIA